MLEKFVNSGNQKHVHDVHEILASMIHQVSTSELGKLEKAAQWLEYKIGLKLDRLIQVKYRVNSLQLKIYLHFVFI